MRPLLALLLAALLPAPALAGEKENKATEKAFLDVFQAAGTDDKARAKAVETLGKAPDGLKTRLLLDTVLPKEEAPAVLTAAVSVLRSVTEDGAIKAMAEEAQGKGAWSVRGSAIEALGGIASPLAVAGLVKTLKNGDTRGISNALFALAERHPPEALEDVKKQMENTQWQVRLGALDYLGRLHDASTVGFLAERLAEETGRLQHEVVETLKLVTGKDYKTDVEKWRAYAAGGEAAAEKAGKPAAGAPGAGGPAAGAGGRAVATGAVEPIEPTYYGQKVYSDKIVFVVDLSLSMNEEFVIDRETLIRETGAVVSSGHGDEGGGKAGDEKPRDDGIMAIEWWKIHTRMDFARAQLKYVVSTLQRGQMFDIVWFSDSIKAWKGGLVGAQPAVKVRAAEWLDALKCEGGTNSWGGLTKALNLVGRGGEDENYSRGADTIYFLSDGMPSIGDIKDPEAIVEAIERIHKVRHVVIHVVQIGTSPLPFMKRLAAVTGGSYKFFNAKGAK